MKVTPRKTLLKPETGLVFDTWNVELLTIATTSPSTIICITGLGELPLSNIVVDDIRVSANPDTDSGPIKVKSSPVPVTTYNLLFVVLKKKSPGLFAAYGIGGPAVALTNVSMLDVP